MPEADEFLTVAEVAAILKLNQQTIRNRIDAGKLPGDPRRPPRSDQTIGLRPRCGSRLLGARDPGRARPSVWDGEDTAA